MKVIFDDSPKIEKEKYKTPDQFAYRKNIKTSGNQTTGCPNQLTSSNIKQRLNLMAPCEDLDNEFEEDSFSNDIIMTENLVEEQKNVKTKIRPRKLIFKLQEDQEVKIRHQIAQKAVKILENNMSMLRSQKRDVESFLSLNHISCPATYTSDLIKNMKEQTFSRLKGIRDIYELTKMENRPGLPDDQFEMISMTPRILEMSGIEDSMTQTDN